MNQASLYQKANNVQRFDAQNILKEYEDVIQWRTDGCDTLLDIGTGSGNVLMDFVYPIMPKNFDIVVGSDVSGKMIDYAGKYYKKYDRVQFRVLDISCDILPNDLYEQFDHITSFYCLHWVQNQRNAIRNIYDLLRHDNGDCLLVFLASNPVYDVYTSLAKSEKWSPYMKDVENFISPLHYSLDPEKEFSQLLQEIGFVEFKVEIRNQVYVYEGLQNLKNNVKAICPFLDRIPLLEHDDFLNDFVEVVANMRLREHDADLNDFKFITPYKLVVAYARKTNSFTNSITNQDRIAKNIL